MIKDKHLAEETKGAAAEERIRRKRMEERQAEYNKIFSLPDQSDSGLKQVKRTEAVFGKLRGGYRILARGGKIFRNKKS